MDFFLVFRSICTIFATDYYERKEMIIGKILHNLLSMRPLEKVPPQTVRELPFLEGFQHDFDYF